MWRATSFTIDWSIAGVQVVDLTTQIMNGALDAIRSIYVDNRGTTEIAVAAGNIANSDPFFTGQFGQLTWVQPGKQALFPIMLPWPPAITFLIAGGTPQPEFTKVYLLEETMPAIFHDPTVSVGDQIALESALNNLILLESGSGFINLEF